MNGDEGSTPTERAVLVPTGRARFPRSPGPVGADSGGSRSAGPAPRRLALRHRARRLLRLLGYVVVCWASLGIALTATDQMGRYDLGTELGVVTGFAQGAAVVLALWRPGPAWALSLAGTVVAAVAARPELQGHPLPGPSWPWNIPEVLAHAAVLLFLALRTRTRVSLAALAATVLTTWVVQGLIGGATYTSTGVTAVAIFGAVVLVGTAFRGLGEARTQLVEQETITAEERARRTLLEERNRIARELHDVVAHHMSVISIQAQVAPHLVENPSEELKENLAGIRQNALEALAELRRVLGVLRSENPEDPYGLGAAGTGAAPDTPQPTLDRLDALMENTRAAGLDVVATVEGEAPVYPPGVQLSAYRIVQEALSNALRHAPGSRVRVRVTHDARGLYLEVVNSRPCAPVPPSPGAGHGLLGMRERAAMLGGQVHAHPTLHGGFAVSAFLPRDGVDAPDALRSGEDSADSGTPAALDLVFPDDLTDPTDLIDLIDLTDPTGLTGLDAGDSPADLAALPTLADSADSADSGGRGGRDDVHEAGAPPPTGEGTP
ncbi:signal transduction histidine kinase [Streptomyces sp. 3330]|uniref:sensor histidine kinase n=1 Tax=Streptomyces sp. 3330 TaxID=2817755 RepID=UPI002858EC5F|nr:sensor histidine kinase [Streptomyces sp. 3330]MDR6976459.1 signal transduction histidine kinase [Streptomyces sp. 3330]